VCGANPVTAASRSIAAYVTGTSPGCIGGDPNTLSARDPYYIFPAVADYRLQSVIPAGQPGAGTKNPALDSALDDPTLYYVPAYPAGPLHFLGLGPDRGGRETY